MGSATQSFLCVARRTVSALGRGSEDSAQRGGRGSGSRWGPGLATPGPSGGHGGPCGLTVGGSGPSPHHRNRIISTSSLKLILDFPSLGGENEAERQQLAAAAGRQGNGRGRARCLLSPARWGLINYCRASARKPFSGAGRPACVTCATRRGSGCRGPLPEGQTGRGRSPRVARSPRKGVGGPSLRLAARAPLSGGPEPRAQARNRCPCTSVLGPLHGGI